MKTINLGDIIKLEYGKPLPQNDRKANGLYPAYGANGVKVRTDKFYSDKPSIIVGRKGSAGELTLTDGKFWPLDVTYFVTHDENETDLLYIFHLLKTLDLPSLARGVKPGINRNDIYAFKIQLPSLNEQLRVVARLEVAFEKIDRAIELNQQNIKNTKGLYDSYLYREFEASQDWRPETLESNVKFIDYRGKTPKKTNQGMRLITAKNIRMGYLNEHPREYVDPEIYESWMVRGIPIKGDVLFTSEAPLANVAQLDTDERVVFAQRCIILQPNRSRIYPDFLKYALLTNPVRSSVLDNATGTTVSGIRSSLLKKITIYVPNMDIQRSIVSGVNNVRDHSDELVKTYRIKQDKLQTLKQSMLSQAFSWDGVE